MGIRNALHQETEDQSITGKKKRRARHQARRKLSDTSWGPKVGSGRTEEKPLAPRTQDEGTKEKIKGGDQLVVITHGWTRKAVVPVMEEGQFDKIMRWPEKERKYHQLTCLGTKAGTWGVELVCARIKSVKKGT